MNPRRFWLKLYKIQKKDRLMAYKRFQNILPSGFSKIWRNIMIPFWSLNESNWIQRQKCWFLPEKRRKCLQWDILFSQTWSGFINNRLNRSNRLDLNLLHEFKPLVTRRNHTKKRNEIPFIVLSANWFKKEHISSLCKFYLGHGGLSQRTVLVRPSHRSYENLKPDSE